jgi:glycosyltransferase involved in cell wall biosynthesis
MRVSVILPTYNRASLVRCAVDSVLSQQGVELELIAVDDGSTDGTGAVLEAVRDPRLAVVRLPARRGAGAARNAGVTAARGEWLAFQDSDDEWLPDHLAVLLAARDDEAGVGVVYSDMWIEHGGGRKYFGAPRLDPRRPPTLARALAFGVARIGIQASLVSRSAFDRVGGFDEALPAFEDFELFARLTACCRFCHVARPTVLYRPAGDSLSHDHRRVAAALEAILRKHGATIRARRAGLAAYLLQIGRRRAGYGDWTRFHEELGQALRTAPLSVAGVRAAFYLADDWLRRRLVPAIAGAARRVWPRAREKR